MDRKKIEFWELKEGQYVLIKFKVEGKDEDLSLIVCKVKEIHRDSIFLDRTTTEVGDLKDTGKPVSCVIFNTGYGMRSGLDIIKPYEIFESSEGEYMSELV